MRRIARFFNVLFNPIGSMKYPRFCEGISKKASRHKSIIYITALVITALIIVYCYREYIFK